MLSIVSIILSLIILVPISFYNFYLMFKYLYIKNAHSDNIDSDKTQSLIKKVQSVISLILYYSIGDGYGESIKLFNDIYFIDNDDDKDDLFKQHKSTTRKLTSIIHKIMAIIVLLILLLIALAMIS